MSITEPESTLGRYLQEILRAGERGRDLISKMLACARSSPVEMQPVDAKLVIEEVLKLLSATLPVSLTIHLNVAPEVPLLRADPAQLHQVITNLILNAYHAIGERGNIYLQLSGLEYFKGDCSSCHQSFAGNFIEISVRDDGKGMADELVDKIFVPFFTTKQVGKGSGMGLSMVHGIMHSHQGHVVVETEQGVGSHFRLFFQAATTAGRTAAEQKAEPAVMAVTNKCIMVVDDESGVTGFLTELLSQAGYQVRTFNDPLVALNAFRFAADSIDLVITDQTMPNLSGAEFAQQLLLLQPKLPVILCTGYSESVDEDLARKLGIARLLKKPVGSSELLETLHHLLA